ncbi:sensor histidine kinase [Kribbella sp. CA-245084]|uniref:sensor histidine kinase n=1 Tax=Kribbella sp. CA-245084 TaxID=3239940 RepID=UPI003D9389EE
MPVRLVLVASGFAVGLFTEAIAHGDPGLSFALSTSFGTTALLVTGWGLMGAGLALSLKRPRNRAALGLYLAGCAWFLAEWDNPGASSSAVFSIGLALYAVCPAAVAHAVLMYPSGQLRSWINRIVVGLGYAVTVGIQGLASATVFDPGSLGCSDCASNLWLIADRPSTQTAIDLLGVRAGTAWAVIAFVAVAWRVVSASTAGRRAIALVSTCALGYLGLITATYATSLDRGFLGTGDTDRTLWLAQAATLSVLAVAVLVDLVRARMIHRTLTRLVVDLGRAASPGRLRDAMADSLGDPDLVIAYPINDGSRYVDAMALAVQLPPDGDRRTTTLRYAGAELAVLVHRPGLFDGPGAVGDLVSAVHLGLENERLQAEALAQLAEVRSSGVRVVAAGDEERRRLERDLHDGAQQRLVGLSLALRLARTRLPPGTTELDAAESELQATIADLRDLAHGLSPVMLKDEGLPAALRALSETDDLIVGELPVRRLPDVLETTAYLLVAEVARQGATSVTGAVGNDWFSLELQIQAERLDLGELPDRVRAVDGTLEVRPGHVVLRLPLRSER